MNPEEAQNNAPKTPTDQAKRLEEALAASKEKQREALPTLKTYQSDVAEAIKKDNISVIKMALAEKKRQEATVEKEEVVKTESRKSVFLFVLSAILILAGVSVLGYFYFTRQSAPPPVVLSGSLLYAEKQSNVNLTHSDVVNLINGVNEKKKSQRNPETIENLSVSEKTQVIGGNRLVTLLNSRIPPALLRSIEDPYMLGLYQTNDHPELFLILISDSAEIAFPGMLEWEKDLQRDMAGLFSIPDLLSAPAPSASSSTSSIPLVSRAPRTFTDRVIANRDTRVLTDQNGQIVFLYSFLDPKIIVMTSGEEAFKEVLNRFIQAQHLK